MSSNITGVNTTNEQPRVPLPLARLHSMFAIKGSRLEVLHGKSGAIKTVHTMFGESSCRAPAKVLDDIFQGFTLPSVQKEVVGGRLLLL